MGLDNVIAKIEKDATVEILRIDAETENKIKEILKNTEESAKDKYTSKIEKAKLLNNAMVLQEKSSTELEVRKILLMARKDILNKTFQECLDALKSIKHEAIIPDLITKSKREIPDAVYIYSNKRDEPIVRSISGMTYAGNIDCIGGIIIENSDKTLRLDLRYETIMKSIWDKNLKEIAKKLFG